MTVCALQYAHKVFSYQLSLLGRPYSYFLNTLFIFMIRHWNKVSCGVINKIWFFFFIDVSWRKYQKFDFFFLQNPFLASISFRLKGLKPHFGLVFMILYVFEVGRYLCSTRLRPILWFNLTLHKYICRSWANTFILILLASYL